MRILHVIPSIAKRYGGPSKAVLEMCRYQNLLGIKSEILTTHFPNEKIINLKNLTIYSFKSYLGRYNYSPNLRRWLKNNIKKYDIIHIHSVFCYTTFIACKLARKNNIPYIIRTIGQLIPWCLNYKKLKKKIYLKLFEKRNLIKADAIHFTTNYEKDNTSNLFYKNSFILPLGTTSIPNVSNKQFLNMFPQFKNKKIILFLSRIHPVKGLDILLASVKELLSCNKDLILVIAGTGKKQYLNKLKKKASLISNKQIFFIGFVDGMAKNALFSNSNMFILPSYSENFGIVVIEALSAGLPVAISDKVGIADDVRKANAGIVFHLNKEEIRESIEILMKNKKLSRLFVKNGKRLVNLTYNWEKISQIQLEIYKKIINKNEL